MKAANIIRIFATVIILFLVFFSLNKIALAQNFDVMRNYLETRDLLMVFKMEVEKEMITNKSVTLEKIDGYQANLKKLSDKVELFKSSADPLSRYYKDRLVDLYEEIDTLLVHLRKRKEADKLSVQPAQPPKIAASESIVLPQPESVVTKPVASITTVVPVQPPAGLVKRVTTALKSFFLPIGFRNIIPRFVKGIGKRKKLKPISLLASGTVSLIGSATLQVPIVSSGTQVVANIPSALPTVFPASTSVPPASLSSNLASASPALPPSSVISPRTGSEAVSFPPLSVASAPNKMSPLAYSNTDDPRILKVKSMRPVAVMIENHKLARPQTGIFEAEVVYEIPVEGGITRFMALFYHMAGLIGPVRSCRDYFVDRALEVNALYAHCGGSPQGYQYLASQNPVEIDEISSGEPFFRDSSRKAPHNLYTKMKKLVEYVAKKHPMELSYLRLPLRYGLNPTVSEIPNRGVHIKYHANYSVSYRFSPSRNLYFRYMNGEQHLDRVTLKPIAPGTIIIQQATMKVIDDKGRQDISFIGEGKCWVIYGGSITECTWKKKSPRDFTEFTDLSGKPVVFANDKPVWIQVISPREKVTFDPPINDDKIAISKLEKH
ncbi:MAG: DUF3048 domain-containing protein [Candidatus Riflebacteria bacterium]|nr:DUF3048 domain-containing protein [Candidatus Riflebacteria bacterium]